MWKGSSSKNIAPFVLEKLKGRDHPKDLGVDWKMNNRPDLKEIWWVGKCGLDASGSK
jgi:hypothetical protein